MVGAVCFASVTLANGGTFSGKKATVYPDEAAGLTSAGAVYTGARVKTDGRIVTVSGPESAREFGEVVPTC